MVQVFSLILFILKIVFLVLLYLFLVFVVMGTLRDIPGTKVEAGERRGRRRALLIVRPATGDKNTYRLIDNFTIGRASDNDLVLEDTFASQHHAKILATGDGFVLQDLDSTNGTFIEGKRVSELVPLHDGTTITIGKASLAYEEEQ